MRRFVAVIGAASVLALAGCGGDDEDGGGGGSDRGSGSNGGNSASADERAARDTVERYVKALVARDGAAACALQTEEAQEAAAREVPGASSCERAHEMILNALGGRLGQLEEQFEKAFTDVEVSGDTAEFSSPNDPGDVLKLRREGGGWKIDDKVLKWTPRE
jgi:hypothetical protein